MKLLPTALLVIAALVGCHGANNTTSSHVQNRPAPANQTDLELQSVVRQLASGLSSGSVAELDLVADPEFGMWLWTQNSGVALVPLYQHQPGGDSWRFASEPSVELNDDEIGNAEAEEEVSSRIPTWLRRDLLSHLENEGRVLTEIGSRRQVLSFGMGEGADLTPILLADYAVCTSSSSEEATSEVCVYFRRTDSGLRVLHLTFHDGSA